MGAMGMPPAGAPCALQRACPEVCPNRKKACSTRVIGFWARTEWSAPLAPTCGRTGVTTIPVVPGRLMLRLAGKLGMEIAVHATAAAAKADNAQRASVCHCACPMAFPDAIEFPLESGSSTCDAGPPPAEPRVDATGSHSMVAEAWLRGVVVAGPGAKAWASCPEGGPRSLLSPVDDVWREACALVKDRYSPPRFQWRDGRVV